MSCLNSLRNLLYVRRPRFFKDCRAIAMVMMLRDFLPQVFYRNIGWLVGDNLLLRYFGPYVIIFHVCVVITVAMVIMLRDFAPYGIIFITMCVY
jgi:hypothetical protein